MKTYRFSKWLYRHFGILTKGLKNKWQLDGYKIQQLLNSEHNK